LPKDALLLVCGLVLSILSFFYCMKISTFFTALLVAAAGVPAVAQTELNSRPVITPNSRPAPAPLSIPDVPAAPPFNPSQYRPSTLELHLGWGGPYGGLGVSYARLIGPGTDLTVGLGLGVGGKIGFGVRHFLSPTKRVSPYFGVNLARSGRVDDVDITLDEGLPTEEKVNCNFAPSGVLHLRAGLRWQPSRAGLLGTLGYGARFTGDPVSYANGQLPSYRMRNIVNIVSAGGLEMSLGLTFGLNH
jgi:hypothetical protein